MLTFLTQPWNLQKNRGKTGDNHELVFRRNVCFSANLIESTFAGNALSITLDGFDHPTASSTYVRNAGLDTASADGTTTYRAFTFQETPQSRIYLAYFAEGSNVSAGVIAEHQSRAQINDLRLTTITTSGALSFRNKSGGTLTLGLEARKAFGSDTSAEYSSLRASAGYALGIPILGAKTTFTFSALDRDFPLLFSAQMDAKTSFIPLVFLCFFQRPIFLGFRQL